ncbi:SNF2 helicase associated domain-containing protein [Paenibacillus hodogayensis]|uniref:SNF2 helicase associated domain-containing protein n=1 Tax=Paenibacillus hodogayensis TaxID=279208 RepID=A0ABV5W2R7_9BACL
MSFSLTPRVIKLLCGPLSYEKGETLYRDGCVSFHTFDTDANAFEAFVEGSRPFQIGIDIDGYGDVAARCTCPAPRPDGRYCGHIAAVLLNLHHIRQDGRSPDRSVASLLHKPHEAGHARDFMPAPTGTDGISAEEMQLTTGLLGLFSSRPNTAGVASPRFDSRTPLDMELTCSPVAYSFRSRMFGISIKIGPGRLYIVQKIRDFLEAAERSEPFAFSRHFTYDPKRHRFHREHGAIMQELIRISRNERMVHEASKAPVAPRHAGGERTLLVPPASWDSLLPLLEVAPSVQLQSGADRFDRLRVIEEPLPLRFFFDRADSGEFLMKVDGLDPIVTMEDYGLVLHDGKLLPLAPEAGRRLATLQRMMEPLLLQQVRIPAGQMEAFLDRTSAGLMKLGRVELAEAVANRMVKAPLKARLYLDRVKDRLLAGLEFRYGEKVINPLETKSAHPAGERILVRDHEGERRILELMELAGFATTESGYFLDDEEAEYEFLYRIMPELEKLLHVYATSAVKVRLFAGPVAPVLNIRADERTEWLEVGFDLAGIPEADIRHLLKTVEEKRSYYRLPNGALLPLESAEFQEIVRALNELGIRQEELKNGRMRLPVARGLLLSDSSAGDSRAVKLSKPLRVFLDDMRHPDSRDFPVPDMLQPVLRDYQKYGYQWMKTLAHYRFGGILADDMGLGKTVQSIAYLASILPELRERSERALIVAPASLVYNWRNELAKFAPHIRAVIADGDRRDRASALRGSDADVIITSYPLLRQDISLYAGQTFHTLLLDEAQAFKNAVTQTAQAVKAVRAPYRFALTGTPIENSMEELWSIFEAVFPGLLPDRKTFNELSREDVARLIRPFVLRRLKSDVLKELPDKIESLQACELLPDQKKLYAAYLAKLRHETLKHLDEDGFGKSRIRILAGLTRLRQICCHPALFVEGYEGRSAKFELLLEMVDECRRAGRRTLVFSQFTGMLDLIGRELGQRDVPYFYLDGQTPGEERVELSRRFNEGERDLFLVSLKAGGTGLNLTGADTVILYDLWWNPAVEQQAADRAHRIGQTSVVQVIRLVAQGTVEDKMVELQQRKRGMIDDVLGPNGEALSSLTEQDIRELLSIG